jgi:signal transduction histidine kinase
MMKSISIFLLLFLFSISNCKAQILMGSASNQFEIKSEYIIDSTNQLSLNQVSKLSFLPNESSEFHFENNNTIWLKIDLKIKKLHQEQFVLGFTQPFIDSVVVYKISKTGILKLATSDIINKHRTGFYKTLANPTLNFNVKNSETNQIFICLRNKIGTIKVKIVVTDTETALNEIITYERLVSIFFGFLSSIFILSIIFYLMSKTSMYLFYSLYIGFICIFIESTLGNLNIFFPNIHEFFTGQNSDVIYGHLAVVFNLLFLEKLFAIPSNNYKFQIFKKTIIILSVVFFIYDLITNTLPTSLIVPLLMVVVQISILFFAFRLKNNLYKLYLIGLFPLAIICIIRILALLHLIVQPYGIGGLVFPAVSFELLILMILQSKVFFDEIKEKNLLKTKIITSQIETQETERKIIAQDLHDDLGATLSALKGSISKVDFSEESQNLLNKAITDLRAISRRLLPADFEMFGFIPSIEKYIADINKQQKIDVTFIVFGEIVKLNTEKELNIYRIISELVNNSFKYNNGQNATVQLIYHQDYLFVSVEDDGQIENKNENNLGIGLKNVISRLEYLNATIIEKGGQKNYSFVFEIPYKPNL